MKSFKPALLCIAVLFWPLLEVNGKTNSTTEAGFCVSCAKSANSHLEKSVKASKKINNFVNTDSCNSPDSNLKGAEDLQLLIKEKNALKAKEVITVPSERTANSLTYKFPEKTLKPGENLYFAIPSDLQKKRVSFVVLGHRQDPSRKNGSQDDKWDANPGLSSVQVHAKNFSKEKAWRYWAGSASGKKGAKYAEHRPSAEIENLYEWQSYGSKGVQSDDDSKEPLKTDGVRISSVGKDEVLVSELTIKFTPPTPTAKLEKIFTPGTSFNKEVGEHANFGGGQNTKGKFPGALVLGGYGSQPDLPPGWKIINGNTLSIPLPKGKVLSSVEVLGGDSHPDGVTNKDGGYGTPGWAKASVGISSKGKNEWFLQNENVPPEGTLTATPRECKRIIQDGDHVLIQGNFDAYYIMGVRIGLTDK